MGWVEVKGQLHQRPVVLCTSGAIVVDYVGLASGIVWEWNYY